MKWAKWATLRQGTDHECNSFEQPHHSVVSNDHEYLNIKLYKIGSKNCSQCKFKTVQYSRMHHIWWNSFLCEILYGTMADNSTHFHAQKLEYRQPNKIMAYLTFHMWLVSVCNIHNNIWMVQTKTSHLGKVSYSIILLGWRYSVYIQAMNVELYAFGHLLNDMPFFLHSSSHVYILINLWMLFL